MKTIYKNKNVLYLFVAIFILSSCVSKSGKIIKNEYLDELPSIEKQYLLKIKEKGEAIKKCTDMNKAFKLSKELNLIKEEKNKKIEKYSKILINKELPFEGLKNKPYFIKNISINNVTSGNLNIKFTITINEDIKNNYGNLENRLFIYYKALDKNGQEISNSKTIATNFGQIELKKGSEYEAFGTWQSSAIINLENFAKIVEITKEEYDKK
ncbi:MAG TPA: hypothetical protein P5250_01220 [Bacteroidales bacterium]|mgnify:CR=1 FL=1|nr:hypothetical protein [Bacteroidales bacterium]